MPDEMCSFANAIAGRSFGEALLILGARAAVLLYLGQRDRHRGQQLRAYRLQTGADDGRRQCATGFADDDRIPAIRAMFSARRGGVWLTNNPAKSRSRASGIVVSERSATAFRPSHQPIISPPACERPSADGPSSTKAVPMRPRARASRRLVIRRHSHAEPADVMIALQLCQLAK